MAQLLPTAVVEVVLMLSVLMQHLLPLVMVEQEPHLQLLVRL
jgi:hypothetical protein